MWRFLSKTPTAEVDRKPVEVEQKVETVESVVDGRTVDEQLQSPFLARLPAEVRNQVYYWVFTDATVDARQPTEDAATQKEDTSDEAASQPAPSPAIEPTAMRASEEHQLDPEQLCLSSRPPHPLSLLLTCRKIAAEATLLAFSTHTHKFAPHNEAAITFHLLRQRTFILPPTKLNAITSLAYDICAAEAYYYYRGTKFLSNALVLFPALARLELRLKRGKPVLRSLMHTPFDNSDANDEEGEGKEIVVQRVPHWLRRSLREVREGREYAWPQGQKWTVHWPQLATASFLEEQLARGRPDVAWDTMADGLIDGVQPCACGCGEPSWLAADLLQQTGRRVRVEVLYYGDWDRERAWELRTHRVKLRPGSEQLSLTTLGGGAAGFGWDGEEEYWKGFAKRTAGFTGLFERMGVRWGRPRESVAYGPKGEEHRRWEVRRSRVRLVEGAAALPVTSLSDKDGGFGWDGEEEFWERLREIHRENVAVSAVKGVARKSLLLKTYYGL